MLLYISVYYEFITRALRLYVPCSRGTTELLVNSLNGHGVHTIHLICYYFLLCFILITTTDVYTFALYFNFIFGKSVFFP